MVYLSELCIQNLHDVIIELLYRKYNFVVY